MDVTLENADEVYRYYSDHRQSRMKALAMYGVLAARHRPRVRFEDDAHDRLRAVVRRSEVPLVIAANHVRQTDPFILAASGFLSPLRPRIGRMRVLAKDELFDDPDRRRKIDDLGGIPVFRQKDHGLRAAATAGKQMMDVCIERMGRGDSIAIFPEGTCNEEDPRLLQKVSSGVGHIASGALKKGSRPWLVCAGIAYPDQDRPVVVFSDPIALDAVAAATPAQTTRLVAAELQRAVTAAHASLQIG
ncbi:1-acyl-sn-glycerol-3-phosphate acyltransferase [Gordonia sp. LUNF6]|uniref:1-acyl-sn-glycerol-3-phosphate acyltransferase n=1 Tax=Gordonia TaxID=2053 RepID=UPI00241654FF|nr:1-acyl-sn-glycerol-3-phosphate acyltransferase [Gordonia sihwensis]WFN94828.1 1-acyl-sn-glycerol-3-phosphate acyltransferase [Gordonia sihwensis]